jgi:hypothetical protein
MISDTSARQCCHIFTSEDVITDKPISGHVRGHLARHRSVCARQGKTAPPPTAPTKVAGPLCEIPRLFAGDGARLAPNTSKEGGRDAL